MKLFLFLLLSSFTSFAGGIGNAAQKIMFRVISYQDGNVKVPTAFIKKADMVIMLTLNTEKEFVYMENSWLHFGTSSEGALVKIKPNQYQWNPTNSYDTIKSQCVVTMSEKLVKGKPIRTFLIDINQGKEKIVIVSEQINSPLNPLKTLIKT